jgi:hypothetical protein
MEGDIFSERSTAERCQELSQGYAFFAYPWKELGDHFRTTHVVRGIRDTSFGVRFLVSQTLEEYAKNAYTRLISQHAFSVRQCPNS